MQGWSNQITEVPCHYRRVCDWAFQSFSDRTKYGQWPQWYELEEIMRQGVNGP
jgi:hypothetical protein